MSARGVRLAARLLLVTLLCLALPAPLPAQDRWFAPDKAAHFGATLGISMGTYAGAALVTEQERWRMLSGVSGGLGAAAAKELWDRSHGGTPSWRDFTWGVLGTAAGVAVSWLVDRARGPRGSPSLPSQVGLTQPR